MKITAKQFEDLSDIVLEGSVMVEESLSLFYRSSGSEQGFTPNAMRILTNDFILMKVLSYLEIKREKK